MAEWISTKDELPEVGKDVLGYDENIFHYCVATYSKTYETFFVGGFAYNNITHWQELPKPPRTQPDITKLEHNSLCETDTYKVGD